MRFTSLSELHCSPYTNQVDIAAYIHQNSQLAWDLGTALASGARDLASGGGSQTVTCT